MFSDGGSHSVIKVGWLVGAASILLLLEVVNLPRCAAQQQCNSVEASKDAANPLRAYEPPSRERVEAAVDHVWFIFGVAAFGLLLFFLGYWYYYEPVTSLSDRQNTHRSQSSSRMKSGNESEQLGGGDSGSAHRERDENGRYRIS